MVLLFLYVPQAWSECGKLCDYAWWKSMPSIDELGNVIKSGADVNGHVNNKDSRSPLYLSVALDSSPAHVKLLLESGAKPSNDESFYGNPLFALRYIENDDHFKQIATMLIDAGADINAVKNWFHERSSVLMSLAATQNLNRISFLIENGAKIDAWHSDEMVLHSAARNKGHEATKIIDLFIKKGADVNAKGDLGTPLHYAVNWGTLETVLFLIHAGADIDAKNHSGLTPLHDSLERYFMSLSQSNSHKRKKEALAITNALISIGGANVRHKAHKERYTPLHWAASFGTFEQLKLLLNTDAKLDINSRTERGDTPIFSAAGKQGLEGIKLLIESGANPKVRNLRGETPLHAPFLCCKRRKNAVAGIEFLIKIGLDVNARDTSQRTPLHSLASSSDSEDIITLLINAGADLNAKDEQGKTPFDIMQDNKDLKNSEVYWKLSDARFK